MADFWNLSSIPNIAQKEWRSLAFTLRIAALQECENQLARGQSRPACRIVAFPGTDNIFGYFSSRTPETLYVNQALIDSDDPVEAVLTVAHEGRHAYQWDCILNPNGHTDVDENTIMQWEQNFDNYVRWHEDQEGYFKEAVERDAFDFEDRVKEQTYDGR